MSFIVIVIYSAVPTKMEVWLKNKIRSLVKIKTQFF